MPSSVGVKINSLRKREGLTLEQLAQAIGSSKSYMWELENKDVARPSAEKLHAIAAVLKVPPEFLTDANRHEPTQDDADTAFFRKFQNAEPKVKDALRRALDALDDDE